MTSSHDRSARIQLAWLFEPGNPALTSLVTDIGAAQAVSSLQKQPLARTTIRPELRAHDEEWLWQRARHEAATDHRILVPGDPDWPAGATGIALCLWAQGPAPAPQPTTAITIAGSRACTAYGANQATDLARDLSEHGLTVTTDGGYGIAVAALRGALTTGHPPVAALPSGLDQLHPAGHRGLLTTLATDGLLLSAYPPGTAAVTRSRIAHTRRLLAALTGGTLLVEAAPRSSVLDSARHALDLGRPTLVVPGPVTSVHSAGCLDLLRGDPRVRPVGDATDVLIDLETHQH
ncbi:DNA-processing protein DprA [Actinoplanes palleronii]|uniref:Smf/DprA SLOG domain-containing protein n=1 Tax=Actinoplanes palleronii TaxID=113570 RepID=A0ABQ4BRQ3_9ACTN|nr:DNA-processing protein DprA [Actinoplanes palleronii]GIE73347.1 hypothetical protein Apa02nite_094550 [Actinoplanes palleronii]